MLDIPGGQDRGRRSWTRGWRHGVRVMSERAARAVVAALPAMRLPPRHRSTRRARLPRMSRLAECTASSALSRGVAQPGQRTRPRVEVPGVGRSRGFHGSSNGSSFRIGSVGRLPIGEQTDRRPCPHDRATGTGAWLQSGSVARRAGRP